MEDEGASAPQPQRVQDSSSLWNHHLGERGSEAGRKQQRSPSSRADGVNAERLKAEGLRNTMQGDAAQSWAWPMTERRPTTGGSVPEAARRPADCGANPPSLAPSDGLACLGTR